MLKNIKCTDPICAPQQTDRLANPAPYGLWIQSVNHYTNLPHKNTPYCWW